MPSHAEKIAAKKEASAPREFTRRQKIALQSPIADPPADNEYQSRSPFHRQVRVITHFLTPIQCVTILAVELDSPPVWHGTVSFMQAQPPDADYWLIARMWSGALEQIALGELNQLMRLPRETMDTPFRQGKFTKYSLHRYIPLTPREIADMNMLSLSATQLVKARDPKKEPGDD